MAGMGCGGMGWRVGVAGGRHSQGDSNQPEVRLLPEGLTNPTEDPVKSMETMASDAEGPLKHRIKIVHTR
jgi:hypothetical protein